MTWRAENRSRYARNTRNIEEVAGDVGVTRQDGAIGRSSADQPLDPRKDI